MKNNFNDKTNTPKLPVDLDINELPIDVLVELKSLEKKNSNRVAKHLLMASLLLAENPKIALQHAVAAKNRAGRLAIVRETLGVVAYHNQEWRLALSELRTAKRISGTNELEPLIADSLRAIKKPNKAIEVAQKISLTDISQVNYIELQIILAGAYQDLDEFDKSVRILINTINNFPELDTELKARLYYAYANALEKISDLATARLWFEKTVALDKSHQTDALQRSKQIG